jgi:peptidoglycan/xylan/chitin deacetylase (PgdA/CDA1 family)
MLAHGGFGMIKARDRRRFLAAALPAVLVSVVASCDRRSDDTGADPTSAVPSAPPGRTAGDPLQEPWVILKADDLGPHFATGLVPERFREFIGEVKRVGGKATLGVVARSLLEERHAYFAELRELAMDPSLELFNHGLTHELNGHDDCGDYHEFFNRPYWWQRSHLELANYLIWQRTGRPPSAFGAPGNAKDDVTSQVVDDSEVTRVWLFGTRPSRKLVLKRTIEIENPISRPNFDTFVAAWESWDWGAEELPVHVFQLHPAGWTDEDLKEFRRVLDYLVEAGVRLAVPRDVLFWATGGTH